MKQKIKENLISSSIGIALVLTFLAIFTFMLSGQSEKVLLSLITGIVVVLFLIVIHIRKLKYPIKKALISIIIGIVACIIIFSVYLLLIGPAYFEYQPASYDYRISVQGLNNYSGGLVTDIIVPIPMMKGEQIFTDDEMQNQSFGNWRSTLVVTKQGKMLAFQTKDKNLTNIDARFRKDLNYTVDIKNIMDNALFYPISNDSTANYTIWVYGDKNVQNYTTYVYIDQNIQPVKSDNNTIAFNLGLALRGNMVHGRAKNYKVDVFEAIPESVKGPIPVKAQLTIMGETV